MKIKEITSQSRRDFYAIYICEHCLFEMKSHGYDDENFHKRVIPQMVCKSCGEKAPENSMSMTPKYAASDVV